eukprot:Opistho-2@76970
MGTKGRPAPAVDDDDEMRGGYTWEKQYERTWDTIKEDATGSLAASVEDAERARRRRKRVQVGTVRRGMMRHLYVVVDMSKAMADPDLKPSRLECTLKLLEAFVVEYFEQNPISQIGFIVTRNGTATKLTELGGNPARHIDKLRKEAKSANIGGEPSLQNALELARQSLRHMPAHTSREVLAVSASLTSCDPGDIFSTIELLVADTVQCSVVGLAAEVKVCRTVCEKTGGTYGVVLDEHHFRELLMAHVPPPPISSKVEATLIHMGFPLYRSEDYPTLCACHQLFKRGGFVCPRCTAKHCEIPSDCRVCGLTLISSPHLARSYHHLFPLPAFHELPPERTASGACAACNIELKSGHLFECERCRGVFCGDCDAFIQDVLHSCPACEASAPSTATVT